MKIIIFIIFLFALSGCSTFATVSAGKNSQNFDCSRGSFPRVYSGVINDWKFLTSDTAGGGVAIIDMPFSLVADTLVLPYTIYMQVSHGDLCGVNKKQDCAEISGRCDELRK